MFLCKEKGCRCKHLSLSHNTNNIQDYEWRNSPAFQEVLLSSISCASYFSSCNAYILIFTSCQLIKNKWQNSVISHKQYQVNLKTLHYCFHIKSTASHNFPELQYEDPIWCLVLRLLMSVFVSKHNTIHKCVKTCNNGEKNLFQERYSFFVTSEEFCDKCYYSLSDIMYHLMKLRYQWNAFSI